MLIRIDDERTHPFPEGWRPIQEDPAYVDDMEVWLLGRA